MKKLLLFAIMVIISVCALTVFVSAAPYTYDFGEVERIDFFENYAENNNDTDYITTVIGSAYVKPTTKDARITLSCTCEKGRHTYPTYYVMQAKKSDWLDLFRKDFVNLNANNPCNAVYDKNSVLAIEVPEGIADFWGQTNVSGAFMNHTSLVYASIPSTMENMHVNTFRGCTSLEWVDFGDNNKLTVLDDSCFNGCISLKGVCLPDSITVMKNATFIGCVNLGPVYLPAKLTKLGTSTQWNTFQSGENGNGAKCTKLFFTNEKFDNPDDVEKPKVYYMPQGFTSCGDQLFRGCTNINDILVFPAAYTAVGDNRSFLDYGATADNPKTVVFLGDMTSFSAYADEFTSYMSYVFANSNDTVGGFTYSFISKGATDVKIYSCASELACTPTAEEWTRDIFTHTADPKTAVELSPSSCTENQRISAYCFCGDPTGEIEVTNTALGHDHNVFAGIAYKNYLEAGSFRYKCVRCDDTKDGESAPALFSCLGYSVSESGNCGIVIGYMANDTALAQYKELTKNSLSFGVFAVSQSKLEDKDIFAQDGTVAEGVIKADVSKQGFDIFQLKITGFTEEQMDIKLALGAYVAVSSGDETQYSYMQLEAPSEGEKYCFLSYNEMLALAK